MITVLAACSCGAPDRSDPMPPQSADTGGTRATADTMVPTLDTAKTADTGPPFELVLPQHSAPPFEYSVISVVDQEGFGHGRAADFNGDSAPDLVFYALSLTNPSDTRIVPAPIDTTKSVEDQAIPLNVPAWGAGVPDVDGDGFDELSYVSGTTHTLLHGVADLALFESSQRTPLVITDGQFFDFDFFPGDLSGDGTPDVALASGHRVYLLNGPIRERGLEPADAIVVTESTFGPMGQVDLNADGVNDLVLAGDHWPIRATFGPIVGSLLLEDILDVSFGKNVSNRARAGDLNDDGYDDLAFGSEDGIFILYSGVPGLYSTSHADARIEVPTISEGGFRLGAVQMVNDDNCEDVVATSRVGMAFIAHGPMVGVVEPNSFVMPGAGAPLFFTSGDVTGDGARDLVFGQWSGQNLLVVQGI